MCGMNSTQVIGWLQYVPGKKIPHDRCPLLNEICSVTDFVGNVDDDLVVVIAGHSSGTNHGNSNDSSSMFK